MIQVSIIVPAYNVEKFISKCIKSLINQTFDSYEILAIDDGSTDNTTKILKYYEKRNPILIKYFNIENSGCSIARNLGITKAKGKYIMFVDADDWIDSNAIEKMYVKAIKTKSDIVSCKKIYMEFGYKQRLLNYFHFTNNNKKEFIIMSPSATNKLFKKVLFNKLCFPEDIFYEDLAIIPSLALLSKNVSFIDEGLYHYYQRQGSIMNQIEATDKLDDIFLSLEILYQRFLVTENLENYHQEIEYIYIKHLLQAASKRYLTLKKQKSRKTIKRITSIMKKKFPNWQRNIYYKEDFIDNKIISLIIYNNLVIFALIYLKISRFLKHKKDKKLKLYK